MFTKANRHIEVGDGFTKLALVGKSETAIDLCIGVAGEEPDGFREVGFRFLSSGIGSRLIVEDVPTFGRPALNPEAVDRLCVLRIQKQAHGQLVGPRRDR